MTAIEKFFACSLFVVLGLMVTFWLAEETNKEQSERQLHNTYEPEVPVENELWIKMYSWGLFEN